VVGVELRHSDSLSMSSANPTSQQLVPGSLFLFGLSLSIFWFLIHAHQKRVLSHFVVVGKLISVDTDSKY